MRISDWSSDVCSSDLGAVAVQSGGDRPAGPAPGGREPGQQRDEVRARERHRDLGAQQRAGLLATAGGGPRPGHPGAAAAQAVQTLHAPGRGRSEENTSELPSIMRTTYAVFCSKKKRTRTNTPQE